MKQKEKPQKTDSSSVFKIGTISLVFLIIAYQIVLFIHRAAVMSIEAHRDSPDTVYVVQYLAEEGLLPYSDENSPEQNKTKKGEIVKNSSLDANTQYSGRILRTDTIKVNSPHSERVTTLREQRPKVETFHFNPNTVTIEDLLRLGFSQKQAQAIDNYRNKGGQFRRKSDFASSFVVSDSIYKRLENYIDIPLLDINSADSAAFDALPGIGPYYAAKMVEMRHKLGGYSHTAQLMDIWNFGQERYSQLSDLIYCSEPQGFALWSLTAQELGKHPYISSYQSAKAIVLYRENTPASELSVEGLRLAGILSDENAAKLSACKIIEPE